MRVSKAAIQATLLDFGFDLDIEDLTPILHLSPVAIIEPVIYQPPPPIAKNVYEPRTSEYAPRLLLNKRVAVPILPSTLLRADVDKSDVNYNIARLNY